MEIGHWATSIENIHEEWVVKRGSISHFRATIAANDVITAGERALIQSVIAARSAGDSWTLIGAALEVSKQAASERFGKAVRAAYSDAA